MLWSQLHFEDKLIATVVVSLFTVALLCRNFACAEISIGEGKLADISYTI